MDYVEVCVYMCYVFWINLMIIIFLVGLGKGFLLFSCSIWVIVICGEFYSILIGVLISDLFFIGYLILKYFVGNINVCRELVVIGMKIWNKYYIIMWICIWFKKKDIK